MPKRHILPLALLCGLSTATLPAQEDWLGEEPVPTVSWHLFGDIGAAYENAGRHSDQGFSFGSFDLLLNTWLDEDIQILSETLIEGTGSDEVALDQERAYLAWHAADRFYAKIGLDHTVSSRWNRRFHHGKWLEQSIERPFMSRFEDDGGTLPMHFSGLELGGIESLGDRDFEWSAAVGNGRGAEPTDRQRLGDDNDSKMFEVSLAHLPSSGATEAVGIAAHVDLIPESPLGPRRGQMREQILNLFWLGSTEQWEWMAEGLFLGHQDGGSGRQFGHRMAYLQLAMIGEAWTPYTRFDYQDMEQGDPYFMPTDLDLNRWQQLIGLRRELGTNAALKLEVGLGRAELREASAIRDRSPVTVALQVSWNF